MEISCFSALFVMIVFLKSRAYGLSTDKENSAVNVSLRKRCIFDESRNLTGICQHVLTCASAVGLLKAGTTPLPCPTEPHGVVCCPQEKRISTKKCQEFMEVLTLPLKAKHALTYDGTAHEKEVKDRSLKCETFLVRLISGGRNAKKREYPYQVALGYGNETMPNWRCGGTLIDPFYVLTAGHCIKTAYGPPKVVLLGDRRLSTKEDTTRELLKISEVHLHPDYSPPNHYNDIALIKLASEVPLSRAVLPACLPDPGDRLDRMRGVEATGWGQTGAFEGQSDILQSVLLKKIDNKECETFFESDSASKKSLPKGIIRSQFCAGDKKGIRDTCRGDSGGPVTVTKENTSCIHYVVGITSFGSMYCGFQQPGVYTNVLSYLDWIEGIVWQFEEGAPGAPKSSSQKNLKPYNEGNLEFKSSSSSVTYETGGQNVNSPSSPATASSPKDNDSEKSSVSKTAVRLSGLANIFASPSMTTSFGEVFDEAMKSILKNLPVIPNL